MIFKYKVEVENQLDKKIIKRLRSDRCCEYNDNSLTEICEWNDIIYEFTTPYSPQQNDIVEYKNRNLKEVKNFMLLSSEMSDNMWGKVVLFAILLLTR